MRPMRRNGSEFRLLVVAPEADPRVRHRGMPFRNTESYRRSTPETPETHRAVVPSI
jgi:hypothetical protein